VVNAVINGACEMLAIEAAFHKSTSQWHHHMVFEDFARNPLRSMEQVLKWATLKPGVVPAQLLKPHESWLVARPEPEVKSFAYALGHPDEVLEGLEAVCLDWTFWGTSYTRPRPPRPMCLEAPSCASVRPRVNCGCDLPRSQHSKRNMFWLGNVTQPRWWLTPEETPRL